jgi:hypothetical protein
MLVLALISEKEKAKWKRKEAIEKTPKIHACHTNWLITEKQHSWCVELTSWTGLSWSFGFTNSVTPNFLAVKEIKNIPSSIHKIAT